MRWDDVWKPLEELVMSVLSSEKRGSECILTPIRLARRSMLCSITRNHFPCPQSSLSLWAHFPSQLPYPELLLVCAIPCVISCNRVLNMCSQGFCVENIAFASNTIWLIPAPSLCEYARTGYDKIQCQCSFFDCISDEIEYSHFRRPLLEPISRGRCRANARQRIPHPEQQ